VADPSGKCHQELLLILSNAHATDQRGRVLRINDHDCTVGVLGSAGIAQGNPCTRGSHCTKTIYSVIT